MVAQPDFYADERALTAAQTAAQSGISELLSQHEAKVITRMIIAHRNGGLTPEDAKIGVAVISELRLLSSGVERTVEQGRTAAKRITS